MFYKNQGKGTADVGRTNNQLLRNYALLEPYLFKYN